MHPFDAFLIAGASAGVLLIGLFLMVLYLDGRARRASKPEQR